MKKKVCEKKKGCRNGLGYCPTVSQYNGKLYCDTVGFGSAVGSVVLRYGGLEGWLAWGKAVSRYKFCIVTEGLDWLGERVSHDTIIVS